MPTRTNLVIRAALDSDTPAIVALAIELGYSITVEHTKSFLRSRGSEEVEIFIAAESGSPIGWICVAVAEYLTSPRHGEIQGFVINERYRGKGVGPLLLARAESWARDRALRFYERNAYSRVKRQHVFEKSL